jgi:chromosome segregation ATPase
MRQWPWIAMAVAVVALAALIYPLVQTQKRLKLAQSELGRANQQIVQARAGTGELERVVANLKTELDAATMARTELQGNLEETNSDVEHMRMEFDAAQAELEKANESSNQAKAEAAKNATQITDLRQELEAASSKVEQLTTDRDTAQAKLSETQTQLEAINAALEKANQATEQANSKATELEEIAAKLARDAEAERNKLQAALDQANAEVERLKNSPPQEKPVPSPGITTEPSGAEGGVGHNNQ